MHENMDIETGQYLQRTDHRIPKGRIPNQVTICYLKLPSTPAVLHIRCGHIWNVHAC
jgi:hypothetical protein